MARRNHFFIPRADRRLGSRYQLLECVGDGSYGWVWRAQRLEDDQIVAVKIPKEQGARNEDLAEGSALIDNAPHPNVIEVYWMGRVPPELEWFAIEMEYFPSVNLAQRLDKADKSFVSSYQNVLDIYSKVLEGSAHLHLLGMSHGDIKPQNILVSGKDVKLADFGSSALPQEMYARTRENGGTILYSAPELVGSTFKTSNIEELIRADVYSLGVLLYYLITMRLPHDTLNQVARHTVFPRPREINSSVSPALEHFTLRCLAEEPAERFASASEMVSQFRTVRANQLQYNPVRTWPAKKEPSEDWSSQAVRLLEEQNYQEAENLSAAEFSNNKDQHAFLLMVTAAYRDGRYFDCLREFDANKESLQLTGAVGRDLRRIALNCSLHTRKLKEADALVNKCLEQDGPSFELELIQASVFGSEAKYHQAADILLRLNREHPQKPVVMKRLILVFEQLRDTGKAAAFLRAYLKLVPDDPWAVAKKEKFAELGLR